MLLNLSELDGLQKYGGSAEFQLKLAKTNNEVMWTITTSNLRLLEMMGIFTGERTIKLVQTIDPSQLDESQKLALRSIKSLTEKLEHAQKNPVFDSVNLSGPIVGRGADCLLETSQGSYKITGEHLQELRSWPGRKVIADGYLRAPGQFQVTHFIEKLDNTLELFVMSLCPFAQGAEMALYDLLAKTNGPDGPKVEIHYIFSRQSRDGKEVFTSLHGEPEVAENLVQMVIRDRFPSRLAPYLRLRVTQGNEPWRKLAAEAGLSGKEIEEVATVITNERDALLLKEYQYAFHRFGAVDRSPTYFWESRRVPDIHLVDAFKNLEITSRDTCL